MVGCRDAPAQGMRVCVCVMHPGWCRGLGGTGKDLPRATVTGCSCPALFLFPSWRPGRRADGAIPLLVKSSASLGTSTAAIHVAGWLRLRGVFTGAAGGRSGEPQGCAPSLCSWSQTKRGVCRAGVQPAPLSLGLSSAVCHGT